MNNEQFKILLECIYNILHGVVTLSPLNKKKLLEYKTVIRKITAEDTQRLHRKRLLLKYKDKALRLLLYLQKQPSIKWDEQGEVCIDGKVISNTHIVDLIRDSTVPIGRRKLTAGIHQFYQFLKSTNIPLRLFRNVEKTNKVRFESTSYKEKKTEEENKEKEETDEYSEDSDNEYIQRK
ncbi:Hypothetical predicted protein [Mytilus galloprovincialis]|uniref:Uncharacterized protein n=1 Tax=Mytilus galloprovincialis TaxID=29158 RepID=A0A8B6C6J8_MYTGA|nr:Hypothetical predicted protein [Mytilus galloprovincialis]